MISDSVPLFITLRLVTTPSQDQEVAEQLLKLPTIWFVELVRTARVRGVSTVQLATLIQRYITSAIHRHGCKERRRRVVADEKSSELDRDGVISSETIEKGEIGAESRGDENGNDDVDEESSGDEDDDVAQRNGNGEGSGGGASTVDYLSFKAMKRSRKLELASMAYSLFT